MSEPFQILPKAPDSDRRVQELNLARPENLGEAAFQVMAAIDANGGNRRWPHGGDILSDSLWHFMQKFAETCQ